MRACTRQKLSAAPFAGQYAVEAIERHGYHPGPAAELSAQHGGPQRSWEYVIRKLPGPQPACGPGTIIPLEAHLDAHAAAHRPA